MQNWAVCEQQFSVRKGVLQIRMLNCTARLTKRWLKHHVFPIQRQNAESCVLVTRQWAPRTSYTAAPSTLLLCCTAMVPGTRLRLVCLLILLSCLLKSRMVSLEASSSSMEARLNKRRSNESVLCWPGVGPKYLKCCEKHVNFYGYSEKSYGRKPSYRDGLSMSAK